MYPVITKPDCQSDLLPIDHIKMIVFYLAKDISAVRYIGARRGDSKTASDYAKFFLHIKQLFEVQNDQKLYDMLKLGRLDAIVMEEQSAKAFALFDNPHIVTAQFNVYAAFRGVDPRSLALESSAPH